MSIGWIYEPYLSDYESILFYNVFKKHTDSFFYRPVAIAKREESGVKYRYLCIAAPKDNPFISSHFADIEIYKPRLGIPYATKLNRIDFDRIFPYQ